MAAQGRSGVAVPAPPGRGGGAAGNAGAAVHGGRAGGRADGAAEKEHPRSLHTGEPAPGLLAGWRAAMRRAWPEWWPVWLGLAVLFLPTFASLFTGAWIG